MTITRNHNVRAAAASILKLAYADKLEITTENMQKYKALRRALKKGFLRIAILTASSLANRRYKCDLFIQNKKNKEAAYDLEVRRLLYEIQSEFFEKAKLLLSKLQETRQIWTELKTGRDIQRFLFEEGHFPTELWIAVTHVSILTRLSEKWKDGLTFVVEEFVGYSCQVGGSLVLFPNADYPSGLVLTSPEGKSSYVWTDFEDYRIKPIPPMDESDVVA